MSDVPLTSDPVPDDPTLLRYLIGRASEEQAEQFDERSVVDEEFAGRLRAVEHDLVDAYANGELTGDDLEGFRSRYLRSAAGLAQVEFAQALRSYRRAAAAEQLSTSGTRAVWSTTRWQLAAAVLVLVASGYLLADNLRLRRRVSAATEAQAGLEQRTRQLQEEVNRQQSATVASKTDVARARQELAAALLGRKTRPYTETLVTATAQTRLGGVDVLALMLRPATRDAAEIPQLAVPKGADPVVLLLPLAAVNFADYEAVLKDAASNRLLWRGRFGAPSPSKLPMIALTVDASLLRPGAYTLELTGISPSEAEPLEAYPFRIVP